MDSHLESTDISPKVISQEFFIFYLFCVIATIALYIFFCIYSEPTISKPEIVKESTILFLNITTGFGVFAGVKIYDSKKSSNEYYKFPYGSEIDKLVQDNISKDYDTNRISDFIWNTINTSKDKYWKAVFRLQAESDVFRKIWNDYNYYTNCKNVGLFSRTDTERLKKSEKAVFSMVYKKLNPNEKK